MMPESANDSLVGRRTRSLSLRSVQGEQVLIPGDARLTHLQFRRFTGCPTCNLHIQSFIKRHHELTARGIQEVTVFRSSDRLIKEYFRNVPFAVIADPTGALYREFGVEKSVWSVMHPKVWPSIARGILRHGAKLPEQVESLLVLPADFLIGRNGHIIKSKHGLHAYDQWSVDELLGWSG